MEVKVTRLSDGIIHTSYIAIRFFNLRVKARLGVSIAHAHVLTLGCWHETTSLCCIVAYYLVASRCLRLARQQSFLTCHVKTYCVNLLCEGRVSITHAHAHAQHAHAHAQHAHAHAHTHTVRDKINVFWNWTWIFTATFSSHTFHSHTFHRKKVMLFQAGFPKTPRGRFKG